MPIEILVEDEWRQYEQEDFEFVTTIAAYDSRFDPSPRDVRNLESIFASNRGLRPEDYSRVLEEFVSRLRTGRKGPLIPALQRLVDEFQHGAASYKRFGDICLYADAYHELEIPGVLEVAVAAYTIAAERYRRGKNLPTLARVLRERGIDPELEEKRYREFAEKAPQYHQVITQMRRYLPEVEPLPILINPLTVPLMTPRDEGTVTKREQALIALAEEDPARFLSMMERRILLSQLDFTSLREQLRTRVLGQERAIDELLTLLLHYQTGLAERGALNIFAAGPTGVGKNHLVESLGEVLEDMTGRRVLIEKVECVNYENGASLNTLLGSWPGYVNSDVKGKLTQFALATANYPFSVLIFDEFEKAHKRLELALLPILDTGFTADHRGNIIDLRGTLLYFTSNIGYEPWRRKGALGFDAHADPDAVHDAAVRQAARRTFNPEFINRLHIVHFNHLARAAIERIVERELSLVGNTLEEEYGVRLSWDEGVRKHILAQGYSEEYGARPIRKVITQQVIAPLDETIHDLTRQAADPLTVNEILGQLDSLRQEEESLSQEEAAALLSIIKEQALPPPHITAIHLREDGGHLLFDLIP